LNKPEEEKK